MISSGASTPPDVPEPSAIAQMIALTTISATRARVSYLPVSRSSMMS